MSSLPAREAETLKLVGFRIEDWRFAIRLEQVQTSLNPCTVTRVFHVPDYIEGIISLRGTIVGVLSLGRLLGLSRGGSGHRRFLVIQANNVQAAIPVHEVFRLPDVPREIISPLPSSLSAGQKQYLEGTINTARIQTDLGSTLSGEDTITLIDAASLFETPAIRLLRGER